MEEVRSKAASDLPRMYEYVDGEGHTYWSFRKPTRTVSPPVRLFNSNRRGTFLMQFIQWLKQEGRVLWQMEKDSTDLTDDG